jgi:hypothetical protein
MSWTVDLRIKERSFLESVLTACFNPQKTEHPYGLHKVHGFSQGKYFNPGDEFRWESRDGIRHRDESTILQFIRGWGRIVTCHRPIQG